MASKEWSKFIAGLIADLAEMQKLAIGGEGEPRKSFTEEWGKPCAIHGVKWCGEDACRSAVSTALCAPPPGDGGLLRDAMQLLDVAGIWKAPVDEQWRESYAELRARYDAALAPRKEGEG